MIRNLLESQKNLESVAVIENGQELKYAGLLKKAHGLRPFLPKKRQEIIAILLPNGGDYIAAFWGTVMAGYTAFPLNILLTGQEIFLLLKQASVKTIITSTAHSNIFKDAPKLKSLLKKIIFIDKIEQDIGNQEYPSVDTGKDKQMVLLNTSGTMGKAKIVRLSERNVESSVLGYLDKLHFKKEELTNTRYILAVPFSSVYGLMIISACLKLSVPIIVFDNAFTLDAFYEVSEKYKATHYEGSASVALLMEQTAGRKISYNINLLKYFGFGGSKVSKSIIENLLAAYPDKQFYQGYGMTETSPLITKHPLSKLEKTDSVGSAIRGLEIAIKTDKIVKTPFVKGEIVVRGPSVMLGYLNNKKETGKVLKGGFLYTGDIGYLDSEGFLYICGRKKNIIITRGYNVYPEEVEECIQNSRLVKDCVVYGQADACGNEIVCADIVPMHSGVVNKIGEYLNTHLAEYKIPQKITFCKFIKKNAAGKTLRHVNKS